ncbi:type II secretion system F family protein [Nocardioides sp.]|uniref:type II secretion system F family protein n=1 Tax=Nocardioides sp. TaxID=35761 RepID=UPI002C5E7250|nr:type II secretion system F family protein [Nocardioides sp.]HSX67212.1 type II secretion system F family protein [Nocardioides sp.]
MTPLVVAAVAAACAAALLWPARPAVPRARSRRWPRGPVAVIVAARGPVAAAAVVWLTGVRLGVWPDGATVLAAGGRFAGPIALVGLMAGGGWWLRRRSTARRVRATRGAAVLALCEDLAGDLAAGAAPGVALARAARRWPEFAAPSTAHRLGGSVPSAWRALAAFPGAGDLHVVAAAWQVAERTGAGLAEALAGVAAGIREQQRTRRLVASELASARATARLMAALPLLTLAVGSGAGDPVGFLLGTPIGLACAAAGVALALGGVGWIEAIASGLERDAAWQPGPRS